MNQDLKIIKKKYGEQMMHLCRTLFPTILEEQGTLSNLLLNHFYPSHNLYLDIIEENKILDFKNLILNLYTKNEEYITYTNKSPEELFNEVGYNLYECKTKNDILKFKKYYKPNELICTYLDISGRLDTCHIFFAIKKDVDNIKRENFSSPLREDEYGTSVLSIQFDKNTSNLEIINRYNHTVFNPNATFSNNLENINPGLTDSFRKYYKINCNVSNISLELKNYVRYNGKLYKYNYELNDVYYCTDNIIIDHKGLHKLDKSKYLLFDYYILDLINKNIYLYDQTLIDTFPKSLPNLKKINITLNNNKRIIKLINDNNEEITIILDNENKILEYINNNITRIPKNFMHSNKYLEILTAANLKEISYGVLTINEKLADLNTPNIEVIGDNFATYSEPKRIPTSNLRYIGDSVLSPLCSHIKIFYAPKLEHIGAYFMEYSFNLEVIDTPKLKELDSYSFFKCPHLKTINAPNLTKFDAIFRKKLMNQDLEKNNTETLKLKLSS